MIVWDLGMAVTFGHLLEMRNYPVFEIAVEKFLRRNTWEDLFENLETIQDAQRLAVGWEIPLAPGKMREGMINLLHLQDMRCLDIDFLEAFKHLQGDSLEENRKAAREHSISLLREQIHNGNTFYIDADVIKETELTVLVPGVLEARTNEIQNLESNPPLSDIFNILWLFDTNFRRCFCRFRRSATRNEEPIK